VLHLCSDYITKRRFSSWLTAGSLLSTGDCVPVLADIEAVPELICEMSYLASCGARKDIVCGDPISCAIIPLEEGVQNGVSETVFYISYLLSEAMAPCGELLSITSAPLLRSRAPDSTHLCR
jgi:hypothetical protein